MTIAIEKLVAVRTVVVHANCPDGTASAIILRHAMSGVKVVFLSYGTEDYEKFPATEGLLFCDLSPPAARADEFVAAGTIVLDHHRSARDVVAKFGDNGVFADERTEIGVSGAALAFTHVWKPLMLRGIADASGPIEGFQQKAVQDFATLVGIRDTFVRSSPRWNEACGISEVLRFYPPTKFVDEPIKFFDHIADHAELGATLYKKHLDSARRERDRSFRTEFGNVSVAIVPTLSTTDIADVFDEPMENVPDVVIGFGFFSEKNVPKISLSLRSHKDFDCSAFAKRFGGGGHIRAAGCTQELSALDVQPYTYVLDMLEEFLHNSSQ